MEKGLGEVSSELAQDRRAWNDSVRDVVNAIGDAGSDEYMIIFQPMGMQTYMDLLRRDSDKLAYVAWRASIWQVPPR